MILILSNSGDLSTELVMDWLNVYNHPFIRINSQDFVDKSCFVSLSPPQLIIDEQVVPAQEINAIWYRRFGGFTNSSFFTDHRTQLTQQAINQLQAEFYSFTKGFTSLFQKQYWLTHPKSVAVNKLEMLNLAQQCGLDIPLSYLISTRNQLLKILNTTAVISKSVYEPFFMETNRGLYTMYTKDISREEAQKLPTSFYPSLIQEKIEKEYELRIFYLEGEFYSMAIFSQQDEKTQVDFRRYNQEKPNRNVPYVLPEKLKGQLHQLMQKIDLNCGSLDVIKSIDGKYYFLEVNPVGQFGMTSSPCNYDLHQKVAKHLINKDLTYGKVYQ
ncbi:grasp-with-spasm system ATP-grasp peptide maturase [marine bacterium AO1-C]|nr:grasp-with-spasm system ATP-grasp peptide maturase [marine bacterium AO1-C]